MERKSEINETVYDGLDIAFIIDATGSMGAYIEEAKNSIRDIINSTLNDLKEAFPENYNDKLKFSIVAYRDHPPQDNSFVTDKLDFTTSDNAINYLSKLEASGGGDFPEAVMDGMYEGIFGITWRKEE